MPSPPPRFSDLHFRLPNAREGEPYAQAPTVEPGDVPAFRIEAIALPEGLGLAADSANGSALVSGTPRRAGEHAVTLSYRFTDEAPARLRQVQLTLLVNPDPKSMWRDLPSPPEALYWKPDQASAAVAGPAFRVLAASKRGRSHAHKGGFRDDHFAIGYLPESDWYVAAVADGAGSAPYSRRGAQLICEQAERHLTGALNGAAGAAIALAAQAFQLAGAASTGGAVALEQARARLHQHLCSAVGHAAYHALKAVHEEAARQDALTPDVKDFASTALIAACKRYPFGTLCAAYWVGDGAVAVYRAGHGATLLGAVDSGQYSGQTRFLEASEVTQEALKRRTGFALVDDMTALILMTDGVSDPCFESDSALARPAPWDQLWRELDRSVGLTELGDGAQQERLLTWLDFWSHGNHDDRTIALIYRDGQP
ncbi:MAG: PP2C family serine/threonine-protein phosphatase [Pseudomonadota bacterium]